MSFFALTRSPKFRVVEMSVAFYEVVVRRDLFRDRVGVWRPAREQLS